MATELSDWFLQNQDLSSYPFKMAMRFAELTEAEIVALLEKQLQKNKKSNYRKCGVKILNGKFTKMKKNISSNYKLKTNIQTKYPVFV